MLDSSIFPPTFAKTFSKVLAYLYSSTVNACFQELKTSCYTTNNKFYFYTKKLDYFAHFFFWLDWLESSSENLFYYFYFLARDSRRKTHNNDKTSKGKKTLYGF